MVGGLLGWWWDIYYKGGGERTYLRRDPEGCGCETEARGGEEAGVGEVEGEED